MSGSKQLRLGAFMRPISIHTAAWRYPGAYADANFNYGHIKRFIQKLEAGKFDAFFMADNLAVLNMPMAGLKRSATVASRAEESRVGKGGVSTCGSGGGPRH